MPILAGWAWGALLLAPLAIQPPATDPPPPVPEPEAPIGAPAAFGGADLAEERVEVPAGSPLRERPHPRAPAVTTVDAVTELPIIERRGGWARVRYGARKGWVLLDPSSGGAAGRSPGPGRTDRRLLAKAVARLGAGSGPLGSDAPSSLGPWALVTDLDPERHRDLLVFLDRIAAQVPGLYGERYGLATDAPAGLAGEETVVLFAREAAYRAFAEEDVALAGLDEGGFAGFGLAALYTEGRDRGELAALLVHELIHLLNTRWLGPDTPPWLEEGMANDLGYSRIGPGGSLDPGGLGGREEVRGRSRGAGTGAPGSGAIDITITTRGARAALDRLIGALRRGRILPLAELGALGWREITDPSLRDLAYAESAFFVRFLLESAPRRAVGFRTYLGSVAAGGPADADALLEALGETAGDWSTLEPAFHRWLLAHDLATR